MSKLYGIENGNGDMVTIDGGGGLWLNKDDQVTCDREELVELAAVIDCYLDETRGDDEQEEETP